MLFTNLLKVFNMSTLVRAKACNLMTNFKLFSISSCSKLRLCLCEYATSMRTNWLLTLNNKNILGEGQNLKFNYCIRWLYFYVYYQHDVFTIDCLSVTANIWCIFTTRTSQKYKKKLKRKSNGTTRAMIFYDCYWKCMESGIAAKYVVVCSVYNVSTLFRNLIKVLTCKERDTLRTRYSLSSTVMFFVW